MKALREWLRVAEAIRTTCRNLPEFDTLICEQKQRLAAAGGRTVPENLLLDAWSGLDQAELRILFQERFPGGRGQYDPGPDVLYLPLAREQCRIALRYRDDKIVTIEPGEAFDKSQWEAICTEIESSVLKRPQKVGRGLSFNTHLVRGSWRGAKSGIQILPPPDKAPLAREGSQTPFILEFPIQEAGSWPVTNYRRMCEHRKLTLVLNLLLIGRTTLLPDRRREFWAHLSGLEFKWVSEWYDADIGNLIVNELSPPAAQSLTELASAQYYESGIGLDGQGLRVPDDLDDSLWRYQNLPLDLKSKFDRATYWMSMAARQWTDSMSASFASLVSAVESLTDENVKHNVYCEKCNENRSHDVPGVREKFRAFFEKYVPDPGSRKLRNKMYDVRSQILHGSELMRLDQEQAFLIRDLRSEEQLELNEELWGLTQTAARNWLKGQPSE
jgi:Apea-like HEPN